MTRRLRVVALTAALAASAIALPTPPLMAAGAPNGACGLLTSAELESIVGKVTLSPGDAGKAAICTGRTEKATVMMRLVTGLDPAAKRDGTRERAGLEMMKKMGAQVSIVTDGPMTCSTITPPPDRAQVGYNTTCTVAKPSALAGVEITARTRADMVPIDRLKPLAAKMATRF